MKWTLPVLCCWLMVGYTMALSIERAAVDGHNDIRRKEAKDENGSNLYELVWDEHLARGAQAWADKCSFEHQHIHGQGENIYYSSPRSHSDDYYIQRALRNWMSEKSQNDGSFSCCFHGHYTCCHYTQVVAARTRKIGCGVGHCDTLKRPGHSDSHNAAFVVCDYDPMGNVAINGHYKAYASGDPCSQCAHGDKCNDGLCVTSG